MGVLEIEREREREEERARVIRGECSERLRTEGADCHRAGQCGGEEREEERGEEVGIMRGEKGYGVWRKVSTKKRRERVGTGERRDQAVRARGDGQAARR